MPLTPPIVKRRPDGYIEPVPGGVLVKFEVTNVAGEKTWKITLKDPADGETKEMSF